MNPQIVECWVSAGTTRDAVAARPGQAPTPSILQPVSIELSRFGIPLWVCSSSFLHFCPCLFPFPWPLKLLQRFLKVVALAWFQLARILKSRGIYENRIPLYGKLVALILRSELSGECGTDWQVPCRCQEQVWILSTYRSVTQFAFFASFYSTSQQVIDLYFLHPLA